MRASKPSILFASRTPYNPGSPTSTTRIASHFREKCYDEKYRLMSMAISQFSADIFFLSPLFPSGRRRNLSRWKRRNTPQRSLVGIRHGVCELESRLQAESHRLKPELRPQFQVALQQFDFKKAWQDAIRPDEARCFGRVQLSVPASRYHCEIARPVRYRPSGEDAPIRG
jgi:hypothetical protein